MISGDSSSASIFLILKQLHDTAYCISSVGILGDGRTNYDLLSCPLRRLYILNGRSR